MTLNWKFLLRVSFFWKDTSCQFWIKKDNASFFELWKLQRVRFWVKSFTTCQMLSEFLFKLTRFSIVPEDRPRLGNVLSYGVGRSVCQVLLLRLALCSPTVINVSRYIETVNPTRVCSSIYLDRDWYLRMFYRRVWGLHGIETNSLVSMTHLEWRHVLWQFREPTWSSIEIYYREWWLRRVCTYVLR